MSAPSGNIVPRGYWYCDRCGSPNQVEYSPSQCSCGHYRSSCCREAGQKMPAHFHHSKSDTQHHGTPGNDSGFESGEPTPKPAPMMPPRNPFGSPPSPSKETMDFGDYSRFYAPEHGFGHGFGHSLGDNFGLYGGDFSQLAGNSSGSWTCRECGASNSSLTPDFCPICSARR